MEELASSLRTSFVDLRGFTLVAIACAWLAGIVLASFVSVPLLALLIIAAGAWLGVILFRTNKQGQFILILFACLLLGALRYTLSLPGNDPHAVNAFIGSQSVTVQGTVADEPKLSGSHRVLVVNVTAISMGKSYNWQVADGSIELLTPGNTLYDPYGPHYDDSVEAYGKLQAPDAYSSPGTLATMIFPQVSVSATSNPLSVVLDALYQLRTTLATIIERALPQPEAALLIALLLSLHTPALTPFINLFNVTGTAHLIAPSGFKVTILAGIVQQSLQRILKKASYTKGMLRRRNDWRSWLAVTLTIACIALYTLLSGAGPAALRAGIMGVLLVLAPRIGRTYNVYTALAYTACLLSVFDPHILWETGFLLSFLGTLGIVLLTPFIQRWLHLLAHLPFGHTLAEISAVTLAAQIATLPIFAIAFKQISFVAPLTNMLTVPLLGTFLVIGLLVCCTGLLSPLLATLCGWIAWPLLWYLIKVVTWCATLPGAYITANTMSTSLAWGYYGLLILVVSYLLLKNNRQIVPVAHPTISTPQPLQFSRHLLYIVQVAAALLIVLATGTVALAAHSTNTMRITFFAVTPTNQSPQGEALLIRTPDNKTVLIDGGLDPTSLTLLLDEQLPSWQRSLDLVILTSTRPAHIGGLQEVVNSYQIGEVLDAGMLHPNSTYALWRRTISERQIPYAPITQGMTISIGTQLSLHVLWPATLHKSSTEQYDNSLVLLLVTPTLHLLLLGDASYSRYALSGLLATHNSNLERVGIVQIVGKIEKTFPPELSQVLQLAQPSMLIVTPDALSSQQKKIAGAFTQLSAAVLAPLSLPTTVQIVQIAQVGSITLTHSGTEWNIVPV